MLKSKILKYFAIIGTIITIFLFNETSYSQMEEPASGKLTQTEFKLAMRKLWEDHVTWTRNVIFNIIDGLGGTDNAIARLLKNQEDIGNAVKPYYGYDAGNKLTTLLKTHITIAGDLLKAAKNGDDKAFKEANDKWFDNANEIAEFLSSANPNWSKADLTQMMDDHLKLTTDEAVARLKKDYAADVTAYDKVHDEILSMSDMLADGIIKQFKNKFSK